MLRLTPNSHNNQNEATNEDGDGDGIISTYLNQPRKTYLIKRKISVCNNDQLI